MALYALYSISTLRTAIYRIHTQCINTFRFTHAAKCNEIMSESKCKNNKTKTKQKTNKKINEKKIWKHTQASTVPHLATLLTWAAFECARHVDGIKLILVFLSIARYVRIRNTHSHVCNMYALFAYMFRRVFDYKMKIITFIFVNARKHRFRNDKVCITIEMTANIVYVHSESIRV